jgi:hypothetical protein
MLCRCHAPTVARERESGRLGGVVPTQPPPAPADNLGMPTSQPTPGPAEVYAALWFGALLVAAGELPDPFPPPIEELALRYFEVYPPEVKA